MSIYLDNAATTQLDSNVLDAMLPYMKDHFGNPSSIHSLGRKTRSAIERARKKIANILNCSTAEIFFTSGGTESNNCVLINAVQTLGVNKIITSKIEHHCILHTIEHLAEQYDLTVEYVNIDNDGNIDFEHLSSLCKNAKFKTIVSLMAANNEIGNLLDMDAVSEICNNNSCYFHSDTVQTIGHYNIDLQKTKIHSIVGSAHKFHGPKGVGFMYINNDISFKPLLYGGGQERNMRAGTENLYGIVGLASAIEIAYQNLESDKQYISHLKQYFAQAILNSFPLVKINGNKNENSLYTVLNLNFSAYPKSALLLLNLDVAGICASGGSACSSGADAGSHVLKAIDENNDKGNSIRFSFSKFNTQSELDFVVEKLKELMLSKEAVV